MLHLAEAPFGNSFAHFDRGLPYAGIAWAEDTAPQGCDRSAVPGAGRQRRPDGLCWPKSVSSWAFALHQREAGRLHSMWYGQSEANYREVFRVAREAGAGEPDVPVVIFFDEVDSIGGERGSSAHQVDDRVADAFMAELNGLEDRGNVLVVTATNRLDALDSALTRSGRLGDLVLRIPRPGRKAARQIFEKYFPSEIPYAAGGRAPEEARRDAIDTAVSMIFAPNGDAELAQIMFRDGKRRGASRRFDQRGRDRLHRPIGDGTGLHAGGARRRRRRANSGPGGSGRRFLRVRRASSDAEQLPELSG